MTGLRNCHARGLHSVVLGEDGGRLRRLFIATPEHTLWRNTLVGLPLSIGYHAHHCDLTIKVLAGSIANFTLRPGHGRKLAAWRYQSPIRGEAPRFVRLFGPAAYGADFVILNEASAPLHLPAAVMHTVNVTRDATAVWLIEEGEEDPHYLPLTLSDDDLSAFDWTGMYEPMDDAACAELLRRYLPGGAP